MDLSTDPYVPLIGTLPAHATEAGAWDWPARNRGRWAEGRGYASAALTAGTAFALTLPRLHRVELHIEPWNTASLRTAERAGYRREGLLRSYMEIGGRQRDMVLRAAVREG